MAKPISDENLKKNLAAAEEVLRLAREAHEASQKNVQTAYNNWKKLAELDTERKLSKSNDISLILNCFPETTAVYNAYNKLINSYCLNGGGYWQSTGQRTVGVRFYKEDCEENNKQIEGLKYLLPYVIPINDSNHEMNGNKPFDIHEYTLSEHGVYHFYIKPDNTVILAVTRYSSTSYREIGDFDAAMKYIQKHHYAAKNKKEYYGS